VTRTRLDPTERRAQLVELGVRMLATRTLDELSVEDIAREAGISRGLLFHYFASKQEFHVEVARAAAQHLLERTAPDPALPPADALRAAVGAFIAFVEENPDGYTALVRGAASGDAQLRAIFDQTRASMAGRVIELAGQLGLRLDGRAELAVHGWVAYAEECTIRWLETRAVPRAQLQQLLARSLPALVQAAGDRPSDALPAPPAATGW
jgi:AcrR family transcriptional regulator